jgi:TraY domain
MEKPVSQKKARGAAAGVGAATGVGRSLNAAAGSATVTRGRPPLPEGIRRRSNLTLRIRDETKAGLEKSATATGRSLSEEAETRLDRSIHSQSLLDEALVLAFGPRVVGLMLVIARVMRDVGQSAGFRATNTLDGASNWLDNAYALNQVTRAVQMVFETVRPGGEISLPREAFMKGLPADLDLVSAYQNIGVGFAGDLLAAVAGDERGGDIGEWAKAMREKLGPELVQRIAASLLSREFRDG